MSVERGSSPRLIVQLHTEAERALQGVLELVIPGVGKVDLSARQVRIDRGQRVGRGHVARDGHEHDTQGRLMSGDLYA